MRGKTPVDIRLIRQSLGLTMGEMGTFISIYSNGAGCTPIPATRINEWEMGVRSVPAYVFSASAKLLLDSWSEDRHRAPEETKVEVDVFYGALLSPPLGELYKLELRLQRMGPMDPRELAHRIGTVRKAQLYFLEKQLEVKTDYVFNPELGPEAEE